jgi:hypothetical protein
MLSIRFILGLITFVPTVVWSATFTSVSLRTEMERFLDLSKPNRTVNTPGHRAAYAYLKQEFEKIAKAHQGQVYEHEFLPDVEFAANHYRQDFAQQVEGKIPVNHPDYAKWKAFTESSIQFVRGYAKTPGKNLVLELKGKSKPREVIYVGAHYDTITHDKEKMIFTPERKAPGADDNASGVMALLSIARELAAQKRDRTIRFVAFDYEEIFFLGSYALAKDVRKGTLPFATKDEKPLGLYNLEMIGFTKTHIDKGPIAKLYVRQAEEAGASDDAMLANRIIEAARSSKVPVKFVTLKNSFNRSDNWSFWMNGLPSVCVSQDWEEQFNEEHYHSDHDVPAHLNFNYMLFVTAAVLQAVQNHASGS